MTERETHAVVIGASMAGLCAAAALARHFQRVTVIERGALDEGSAYRKGVPQGRHLHVLLAAGLGALERTFPAFREQAITRGASELDIGDFGTVYLRGVLMPKVSIGHNSLLMSRPALEECVRDQLRKDQTVHFRTGTTVQALLGDAHAITGVRVASTDGSLVEALSADLVVDASGRGSKLPTWLQGLGLAAAPEDVVRSRVTYASCTIARKPQHLGGAPAWVMTPAPPQVRFGAALALEADRFMITITTYVGEPGPQNYREMVAYAHSLPYPGLHELLQGAEPLSETTLMQDPLSRRRRYELLRRFPAGLLALGDALCSFNPAYGQGMSVAALEGEALGLCLQRGRDGIARRFFAAAAKIVDAPWLLATGADFQWPQVEGRRPFGTALINRYVARVIETAGSDPMVAKQLFRVMHLLQAPNSLFAPAILRRVLLPSAQTAPRAEPQIASERA